MQIPVHWRQLLLLLATIGGSVVAGAKAKSVCLIGVDVAPELTATVSLEDLVGYAHNLARRVNYIFSTELTHVAVAWVRPHTLGVYNSSAETLAFYASSVRDSSQNSSESEYRLCARLLLASRTFRENHVGIAHVGSACTPGTAAVFNVEMTGMWDLDDAALTAAHEIAHVYGLGHSDNPFDMMYYMAVVSEFAVDGRLQSVPVPWCVTILPGPPVVADKPLAWAAFFALFVLFSLFMCYCV